MFSTQLEAPTGWGAPGQAGVVTSLRTVGSPRQSRRGRLRLHEGVCLMPGVAYGLESGVAGLLADVSVGLLGALVIGVLTAAYKGVQNRWIARKYPVSGMYGSVFEDIDEGERVETKAIAHIRQRGRRIFGPTRLVGSDRGWELEGRIDKGGRIHGSYTASDPHDDGSGGFFLELDKNGRLEGVWAGYDSVNRDVTAGRYRFWPVNEIAVAKMEEEHLAGALSVLGSALGDRYVTREELLHYIDEPKTRGLVALDDAGVVGAVTADLFDDVDGLLQLVPTDQHDVFMSLVPEARYSKIGYLHSVAVDPASQGRGIGTALVRSMTETLWEAGANTIVSVGWTDHEGCHIEGPFTALGYVSKGDMGGYWTEDSKTKEYSCPTCGNPCECTARLFVRSRRPALDQGSVGSVVRPE